jgi:Tfp pilus assembly protein PilV
MKKHVAAFTLLETLVAISILLVAIVGPLTIASRGLNAALVSSDQIVATYLTEDAIEYVRFARDSNILSCTSGNSCANTWLTYGGSNGVDLTQCIVNSGNGKDKCYFDSSLNTSAPEQCKNGKCPPIDYDTTSDFYNYVSVPNGYSVISNNHITPNTNAPTKFTRSVSITVINNTEAVVSATTTWTEGVVTHTVALHDDLFEWQL